MGCLVAICLLAAVVLFGAGFVVHILWVLAAIFFVFWLAGYAFDAGRRRATRRRRW